MTNTDKEILDILKSFMTDEEIKDAISKGNIKLGVDDIEKASSCGSDKIKKAEEEDEEKEEEKVEEEMEEKEDKEEKEEGIEKSEKTDSIEKSEENELLKSLETKISEVDELKKSIDTLNEKLSFMTEMVEKMANLPSPIKSVNKIQYFEKGAALKDEEERSVISVSKDKEKLGEILFKSLQEETDAIMKSQIEADIVNVVGGNDKPSEAVCKHLFKNKGIRIVE